MANLILNKDQSIILPVFDTGAILGANINSLTLSLFLIKVHGTSGDVHITINPYDEQTKVVDDGLSRILKPINKSYVSFCLPKELFEKTVGSNKKFLLKLVSPSNAELVFDGSNETGTSCDPKVVAQYNVPQPHGQNAPVINNNFITAPNSQFHFGIGDNIQNTPMNKKESIIARVLQHPIPATVIAGIILAALGFGTKPFLWPKIPNKGSINQAQDTNKNINGKSTVLDNPTNNLINDSLRPLKPLETGKKISDLANGVYFFAPSPNSVVYEIQDPKVDFMEVTNQYEKDYNFEIQKINDRYYLIGFISDEDFAKTGNVSSKNSLYLTLFPSKSAFAENVIAIPFDKVYTINDRIIDTDQKNRVYVLDVGFNGVKQNAVSHIY